MNLTLRAVTPEDEDFLLTVYGSTRLEELALTPWDEEQRALFVRFQFNAQRDHYQTHYPTAVHSIILNDSTPVGRLYLAREDRFIRILDITLLPQFRNHGIGSRLLAELMSEAKEAGLPLQIHVESYNPSLKLFERLGFRQIAENGAHYLMQWQAGEVAKEGRTD